MTRYESHDDIVSDVQRYFASKIFELEGIGMSLENVIIDPGSGRVSLIRVHDVKDNAEALRVAEWIRDCEL